MYLRSLYPELPVLQPTNHHNVLFRSLKAQTIPDHVLYIYAETGKKQTRNEFIERIYSAATILGADRKSGGLGVDTNSMIGIFSHNCLEYMTIVHTSLILATPFVPFPAYATQRELRHYIQTSRPTHVFVHASLLETFLLVANETRFPRTSIFILEGAAFGFKSLDQLINDAVSLRLPRQAVRDADENTLAYLLFSSGTTGLPKAVMISHGNLNASYFQNAIQIEEATKVLPPPDPKIVHTVLGFLPLYHSYGLHMLCLRSPFRLNTIIILSKWDLDLVLEVIPKYKITSLLLIPSVIHPLLSSSKLQQTDCSSVQSFTTGAAYMPPSLTKRMQSSFSKGLANEGYGLTEMTMSALVKPSLPRLLNGRLKADSTATGILAPGLEGMILRSDGTHCLPNEAGELYVKGGTVALGYWENPEATKQAFSNGWLRTGDHLRADSNGNFWFEDRIKDTLKISGLQVSPAEVENTILAEPSGIVMDVAVVGVKHPTARSSDEKALRAWVVLSERGLSLGEDKAREIVESWTRENLSRHKWLRGGIKFSKQLPKSPTGKVLRRVLEEQYDGQIQQQQEPKAKL